MRFPYRPDIDGLRAIAVVCVIAYHFFPGYMAGGFVGVDIFFVISGYLITNVILGSVSRGSFSFLDFYFRRIKRIFPALLLVMLSCFIFGWFGFLPHEYAELGKHIAAGSVFVSHLVLWQEAGYFDTPSDLKPLLHLWSLGIEEQFYIIWPLILYETRRSLTIVVTLLILCVSFYLNGSSDYVVRSLK